MTDRAERSGTSLAGVRRRVAALVAVLPAATALVAASLIGTSARPAPAAVACDVDYTVNQWATGFTAQVQVTNRAAAVTSWTLTWTFGGNQQITSAWNAQVTQSGSAVTAHDAGYNGTLATGAQTSFGFQATATGDNAVPADFALNGTRCGADDPGTPPTSPTTPSTGQPAGSCSDAVFCDGFEDQTGTAPSGAWQVSFPDCQGTGTVSVDHGVAHTGTTSLRVDGGSGYCNHAFALNTTGVPAAGPVTYVRFYVRHSTALPAGHVAFATLTDSADGGRHLRLGGQNQALQWNRESDDATLPAQSPAGVALSVPLPVGDWSCLEFMIDGTRGAMSTWLNGTEVPGLHLDQTPTPDVDAQWLSRSNWRPSPVDLRLGWESYAGGTDTLWYDDVVVDSAPIGC